jgi:hypothetical protein
MDFQPSSNGFDPGETFSYRERHAHRHDTTERIVLAAGSFISTLLTLRFVFALFGANPLNGLAHFVYSFTAPFVAPFYNLFSYDHPSLGAATFQGYTLVAIALYSLITAGLVRLIAITRYQ